MGILDVPGVSKAVADSRFPAVNTKADGTISTLVTGKRIVAVGNSLTAGSGGGGTNYPTVLGTLLPGWAVSRLGYPGAASTDILIHQSGIDPLLTLAGNQIPVSGAVTVSAIFPTKSYRVFDGLVYSWVGTLAGVPGTLRHDNASATWTFTRTTPGTAVACPAGSPFHCPDGDAFRDAVQLLWIGRNNFLSGVNMSDVVRDTTTAIEYLTAAVREFLVLSEITSASEVRGTTEYNNVLLINRDLKTLAGSRYVDVRSRLIDRGLQIAGITPTADDWTAISADTIPPSLQSDTLHLNAAGYTALATIVRDALIERGIA